MVTFRNISVDSGSAGGRSASAPIPSAASTVETIPRLTPGDIVQATVVEAAPAHSSVQPSTGSASSVEQPLQTSGTPTALESSTAGNAPNTTSRPAPAATLFAFTESQAGDLAGETGSLLIIANPFPTTEGETSQESQNARSSELALKINGQIIAARLPPELETGDNLQLRVIESSGKRLVFEVISRSREGATPSGKSVNEAAQNALKQLAARLGIGDPAIESLREAISLLTEPTPYFSQPQKHTAEGSNRDALKQATTSKLTQVVLPLLIQRSSQNLGGTNPSASNAAEEGVLLAQLDLASIKASSELLAALKSSAEDSTSVTAQSTGSDVAASREKLQRAAEAVIKLFSEYLDQPPAPEGANENNGARTAQNTPPKIFETLSPVERFAKLTQIFSNTIEALPSEEASRFLSAHIAAVESHTESVASLVNSVQSPDPNSVVRRFLQAVDLPALERDSLVTKDMIAVLKKLEETLNRALKDGSEVNTSAEAASAAKQNLTVSSGQLETKVQILVDNRAEAPQISSRTGVFTELAAINKEISRLLGNTPRTYLPPSDTRAEKTSSDTTSTIEIIGPNRASSPKQTLQETLVVLDRKIKKVLLDDFTEQNPAKLKASVEELLESIRKLDLPALERQADESREAIQFLRDFKTGLLQILGEKAESLPITLSSPTVGSAPGTRGEKTTLALRAFLERSSEQLQELLRSKPNPLQSGYGSDLLQTENILATPGRAAPLFAQPKLPIDSMAPTNNSASRLTLSPTGLMELINQELENLLSKLSSSHSFSTTPQLSSSSSAQNTYPQAVAQTDFGSNTRPTNDEAFTATDPVRTAAMFEQQLQSLRGREAELSRLLEATERESRLSLNLSLIQSTISSLERLTQESSPGEDSGLLRQPGAIQQILVPETAVAGRSASNAASDPSHDFAKLLTKLSQLAAGIERQPFPSEGRVTDLARSLQELRSFQATTKRSADHSPLGFTELSSAARSPNPTETAPNSAQFTQEKLTALLADRLQELLELQLQMDPPAELLKIAASPDEIDWELELVQKRAQA